MKNNRILVGIDNQQVQGTIFLMVFDFQGIYNYIYRCILWGTSLFEMHVPGSKDLRTYIFGGSTKCSDGKSLSNCSTKFQENLCFLGPQHASSAKKRKHTTSCYQNAPTQIWMNFIICSTNSNLKEENTAIIGARDSPYHVIQAVTFVSPSCSSRLQPLKRSLIKPSQKSHNRRIARYFSTEKTWRSDSLTKLTTFWSFPNRRVGWSPINCQASWWFQQIWKICCSNCIISSGFGMK